MKKSLFRSACVGAATMLLVAPVTAQQDGRPFARTRLDPGPTVTVGQPLRIIVEVLVPSYFTGGPRFATLDVPDALTLFEDRGTNFSERSGRTPLAGQSRSYVIYPQRPGAFRVTEISVTVPYFDDDAGRTTATVAPPPVTFEAVLPPEAEGLSYFISTTRLSLRASYDPLPDTIRVGDAFTRTIRATVNDALAMVVPPIGADTVAGLAVYADPPWVDDQGGERGEQIVGTRTETVTFVALEEGEYEVPGVELQWWDVNAARMRSETVPAISFVVLPGVVEAAFELAVDSAETEAVAGEAASRVELLGLLRRDGLWLLAFVAVVWIGVRIWRRHGARWIADWHAAQAAKAESEEAYFEKFRATARKLDATATLNALMAWYDRARSPSDSAALSGFVAAVGDEELAKAYDALLSVRYGKGAKERKWDPAALLTAVTRARKQLATPLGRSAGASLPPLNPTAR